MSVITPDLLTRFDILGPRYNSYPTADRFDESFGEADCVRALKLRQSGKVGKQPPLSLYVHIPFCESLCCDCTCNKIITQHKERAADYLRYLRKEVELHTRHLGRGQAVSQLHLGGGAPSFMSDEALRQLMAMLREHFKFMPGREYSVEVDPLTVNEQRLAVLAELGFNRLSFGVQGFDPAVQKTVQCIQPADPLFVLIEAARRLGFESVNVDLIYGLPLQTPESFDRTLAQIERLRPDRMALYAYPYLPERFEPQDRIHEGDLPLGAAKVAMLSRSLGALIEAGYVYIGMDHFALPGDALAVAKRQGRLHRNFQGYSTQADCDLIALGVSSIGRIGAAYSQNAKTMQEYCALLDQGRFPVVRGLALLRDDLIRRSVIMAILCQGHLQYEAINLAWLMDFKSLFVHELLQLQEMQAQGLVVLSDTGFEVTAVGRFFVRGVAMVFDRAVQADHKRSRIPKII